MIKLKNISKSYKNTVLKQVDYEFHEGKIYVIKGVSGCGKSTLLNILGGLDIDYSGEYYFNCENVKIFDKKKFNKFRQEIGYIYQNSLLLSNLTVLQNLLLIKNSPESIDFYANKLGVSHLMARYPEQLSGGERQRISIIRSLLNDPALIIADEPTASLDNKNSKIIVDMIETIRQADNVIIIATHENCFDQIADEIINLNYGEIEAVVKNDKPNSSYNKVTHTKENKKFSIVKYVYLTNKTKFRILKLWPTIIIMFVLLCCISLQSNFQKEYLKKLTAKYPMSVFALSDFQYERLNADYNFYVYNNYTIKANNIACLPLFEKKASGLSYDNLIQYGYFPKDGNQVIINREYVNEILKTDNYNACIGKIIKLGSYQYTISGILSELQNDKQRDLVYYNQYYNIDTSSKVFIPYNTIKARGIEVKSEVKMVRLDNLYDKKTTYEGIRKELHSTISVFDKIVSELQSTINFIYVLILITSCIIAVISLLFIKNEIQLELYYRRKEIGYLQVFNVSKKRVKAIIICERALRSAIALGYSLVLFSLAVIAGYYCFNINGMLPLYIIAIYVIIILGYSYITVLLPCNKFLKQKIITLITG